MVKLFGRSDNSNMNLRFSQMGRGPLLLLAGAVIIVLIGGAYFYGNKDRNAAQPIPSTRQAGQLQNDTNDSTSTALPSDARKVEPTQTDTVDRTDKTTKTTARKRSTSSSTATQRRNTNRVVATDTVPNTGAEDFAPFIVTGLVLLLWRYRKSHQQITQAQLQRS